MLLFRARPTIQKMVGQGWIMALLYGECCNGLDPMLREDFEQSWLKDSVLRMIVMVWV